MKPDQLQLGFLKVLKGSLMQKEAEGYGIVYKEKELEFHRLKLSKRDSKGTKVRR